MNQDFIMVSALPGKVSFNWSIWKELSRASEVSLHEKSQPSSQMKVILLQISLPLSLTSLSHAVLPFKTFQFHPDSELFAGEAAA